MPWLSPTQWTEYPGSNQAPSWNTLQVMGEGEDEREGQRDHEGVDLLHYTLSLQLTPYSLPPHTHPHP